MIAFAYIPLTKYLREANICRYSWSHYAFNRVSWFGRTGFIFAVARRGYGWDLEVWLNHLRSFSKDEGRGPFWIGVAWWQERLGIVRGENSSADLSFLHIFIINSIAIIVCFHTSLLFPVSCYLLNPRSLSFVASVLFSILLQGKGKREEGVKGM